MSGRARAVFTCGARVERTCDGTDCDLTHVGECGEVAAVDLHNDGYNTIFGEPEGWHVQVGYFDSDETDDSEETIVRCPQHCKWVTGVRNPESFWPVDQGRWEDAP